MMLTRLGVLPAGSVSRRVRWSALAVAGTPAAAPAPAPRPALGDVACMQFRAAVDVRAISLGDDGELHD